MLVLDHVRYTHAPQGPSYCFNLRLAAGHCVAVRGPSGVGKSTLVNLIAGFLQPHSGTLTWDNRDLASRPPWERPLTTLFQDHNLFEHLDVFHNLGLGLHPGLKLSGADREAILQVLQEVGLDGLAQRLPGALSGGQRQRVALARALLRARPCYCWTNPLQASIWKPGSACGSG